MIRYVLWAVLFSVDIFEFLRIWFGCVYIYIYIRENLYHTLSLLYSHTHAHGGADG